MVYGTYNYSYWGESKPTNITGGPHIVRYGKIPPLKTLLWFILYFGGPVWLD